MSKNCHTCYEKVSYFLIFLLFVSASLNARAQNSIINICDKGADNTGNIMVSALVNSTLDSLSQLGGGTVYFPSGKYFCASIHMKSNTTLYLDAGATLFFSDNFDDYLPMVPSRWEGVRVKTFQSQIYAADAENIAIKGQGHLEGNGNKWWAEWYRVSREKPEETKWQKIFVEENKELLARNKYIVNMHNFLRPTMVMTYNCKRVTIEGVSFSNPPFWTIMPAFSENITIHNITILNHEHSPNTDGIDPSSCRNVRISDCHISVGDDCIVIKSGRDDDGREANVPTENITITNCTMLDGHGGVVIGSEMSGGVKRVTISNCVFEGTDRGIRLKTMRGRGNTVEDIRVSNIVMKNIVKEGIVLNMRYAKTDPEPVSERTPTFRNVHISGVVMRDCEQAIGIYGLEERDVYDVSFHDMQIYARKGVLVENASNIRFSNMQLEIEKNEPFIFRDAKKIGIDNVSILSPNPKYPLYTFQNTQMVKISNCFQFDPAASFINTDEKCSNFYLQNNVMPGTKNVTNNKKISIINNNVQ